MVLDRLDRVRVLVEVVVERAAVVWAEIDPVRVPVGAASAQAAGLKRLISGVHPVRL